MKNTALTTTLLNYQPIGNYSTIQYVDTLSSRVYTQYVSQSLLNASLLNYQPIGNYSTMQYVDTLSSRVYTQYTTQSLLNNTLLDYMKTTVLTIHY